MSLETETINLEQVTPELTAEFAPQLPNSSLGQPETYLGRLKAKLIHLGSIAVSKFAGDIPKPLDENPVDNYSREVLKTARELVPQPESLLDASGYVVNRGVRMGKLLGDLGQVNTRSIKDQIRGLDSRWQNDDTLKPVDIELLNRFKKSMILGIQVARETQ